MLNRTQAPDFKQVSQIDFIHPTKNNLDNGIPVYTLFSDNQDIVRIEFIFDNVNWDKSKPLQALITNTMINNGTKKFTAKEIAERIDFYGAFFQTDYAQDQSSVTLYSLNKHLPFVLPIVKNVLTDSQFPQQELDIFLQNQKQKFQVNLKKNDFVARKTFSHTLFGDTIYGVNTSLTDYDAVNRLDLADYFAKAYNPSNCTLVIAGKFDSEAFELLNETFGKGWEKQNSVENKFALQAHFNEKIYAERADALQSAIRIGKLSINRNHVDFPGFQVLNTVFGGYFGSRLMANIREEKGYTYGIGSGIASLKNAGYFFIATEVGAEVCGDALTEIYKEIDILKTDLVGEDELNLVRNYMLGSMLGSLENIFSHADKFKNIHFSGLGYDYYETYIKTVKNISSGAIKDLANKYLGTENFVEVVVGKR
ncbi:insulinase family protein [Pedobacter changchengzhani]|uniref:Insulinase family protein n=1 Tax=Pedobacter changchengzhani TaxID=2529274 RepID=A0A4R5MMB1_9SPHI|nr:pitrilysin family protein [Pedobacter changchengzhani]TDG36927.1 insulinase family protein [Pedobacter changchengzhani]